MDLDIFPDNLPRLVRVVVEVEVDVPGLSVQAEATAPLLLGRDAAVRDVADHGVALQLRGVKGTIVGTVADVNVRCDCYN